MHHAVTSDPLDTLDRLLPDQRRSLVRVARREGVSAADAVDVVQDALCTFLTMAAHGGSPTALPELSALLRTIVRNAARNRRRRHDVALPHVAVESAPAPDGPSAEELVARAEEHVRLRACVDQLCDTQRAVVMLRMLEERPGEDVAEALGITRGHVDVLLHRAKSSLRVCMR